MRGEREEDDGLTSRPSSALSALETLLSAFVFTCAFISNSRNRPLKATICPHIPVLWGWPPSLPPLSQLNKSSESGRESTLAGLVSS